MSSKKNNGDIIVRMLQEIEVNIQLYHWLTQSYSRHVASDKLYKDLLSSVDKFMEVYMGKYGRPVMMSGEQTLSVKKMTDSEFVTYLKGCVIYFQSQLPNLIGKADTDLLNIRDEIVGEINQALYLCTLA